MERKRRGEISCPRNICRKDLLRVRRVSSVCLIVSCFRLQRLVLVAFFFVLNHLVEYFVSIFCPSSSGVYCLVSDVSSIALLLRLMCIVSSVMFRPSSSWATVPSVMFRRLHSYLVLCVLFRHIVVCSFFVFLLRNSMRAALFCSHLARLSASCPPILYFDCALSDAGRSVFLHMRLDCQLPVDSVRVFLARTERLVGLFPPSRKLRILVHVLHGMKDANPCTYWSVSS